jgi:hypothetical protein
MSEIFDLSKAQKERLEAQIKEMIGPKFGWHSVVIEGHAIPNIHCMERGDNIEFLLDGRIVYSFPKEWAMLAVNFAATAMAIGAGHNHFAVPHKNAQPFGTPVCRLDSLPEK